MTLHDHVHARLSQLGVQCSVVGDEIHVPREVRPVKIKFDDEWRSAFNQYKRARSISFDSSKRILHHNNCVEFYLQTLSPGIISNGDPYRLEDADGNTVEIGAASHAFRFSLFDSEEYERYFESTTKRRLLQSSISIRRMDSLVSNPTTATYRHRGRRTPRNLTEIATSAVRSSLFKVAVDYSEPLVLWSARNKRKNLNTTISSTNPKIPKAAYDENVVSYYKLAKASPFPSQSFLAYYHVMEYYFLRVSETIIHDKLAVLLNNTAFSANRDGLDKIISTIRGQDARSDETEMLRSVLDKFVDESEFIELIESLEIASGEKTYSKERVIFGEKLGISPKKGHALSNAAKILKHIRNAIVHSSDRYKREDCHIPLSDTEDIIHDFIPIVRFCAERVIYGTAI